jgi:predicted nucleic acid-binding protein
MTLRITEAEITRDIHAVLVKVQEGVEVIVEQVAELVHGIYRARTAEVSQRPRAYIQELVRLVPLLPVTLNTAYLVGQLEGQEAAKGNVLPFNDLLIAASAIEQGYSVLTERPAPFRKIPGIQVLTL